MHAVTSTGKVSPLHNTRVARPPMTPHLTLVDKKMVAGNEKGGVIMIEEYNISERDRSLLEAWICTTDAPALFLRLPEHGNVGEKSLITSLASAVYDKNVRLGIHRADSPRRHFVCRNFPYNGSRPDVERFRDELELCAEVTNTFYGVDCIDLSEWVGSDSAKGGWSVLSHHVQAHHGVDFVFMARCSDIHRFDRLASLVQTTCGIPVETIQLLAPTAEMIACAAFDGRVIDEKPFVSWIKGLAAGGTDVNYALSRALSAKARILGIDFNCPEDINRLLDISTKVAAGLYRSSMFGF